MFEAIFITGMARSGTTLVDKIFGAFENIESFSQPLPLLLTRLKEEFLMAQGVTGHRLENPLDDQQFGNFFDHHELTCFLKQTDLSRQYMQSVLSSMVDYSGQYFKPRDPFVSISDWNGGTLSAFLTHYFAVHQSAAEHDERKFAWKETVAEEFIPYFIDQGFGVLLVLRDPRDIVASLTDAQASAHVGLPRPILWAMRQWRKSVAYKHQYEDERQFRAVRYEDLVSDSEAIVDTWADWIGVDPPHDLTHFLEQDGSVWSGNSTRVKHRGITTQSVGRHAELSSRMRVFVEALCFAEMNALGYQPTINMADVERLLTAGPPEDFLDRPALAEYEFSKLRVEEELNRWCNVSSRHGKFDPAEFIFERNFQVLVKAVQS